MIFCCELIIFFSSDSEFVPSTKESDPEEYEYEKKEFNRHRDKNKDGKLDMVRYSF